MSNPHNPFAADPRAAALREYFGDKPEPLHPDLQAALSEGGFCPMISLRPIIHTMYMGETLNRTMNQMYAQKSRAYTEAVANADWGAALSLAERPYRVDVLVEFALSMNREQFTRHLSWVWTDTEHPCNARPSWLYLWDMYARTPKPHWLMTREELECLNTLPDEVTIYRGALPEEGETIPYGLSWTLDRDKANWFADRFGTGDAVTHIKKVPAESILAYFEGRGEDEVIVRL